MVEWRSSMHTSGSHNLTATSTGHGPYLPSFSREGLGLPGSPAPEQEQKARRHLENVTLAMTKGGQIQANSPWVYPTVPGASPNNPTASLATSKTGKTDYCLGPHSSFTSHLPVVEAVLKLFRSCVRYLRDAFWLPLFEHLYICYPAGVVYSGLHQPSGLPSYQAMSPKLQVYYLSGLKLIQISCASVWGQNCLCSAGCKCTLQTFKALPTASSNFTLFCLCWSGWADIFFFPAT